MCEQLHERACSTSFEINPCLKHDWCGFRSKLLTQENQLHVDLRSTHDDVVEPWDPLHAVVCEQYPEKGEAVFPQNLVSICTTQLVQSQ